MKTKKFHIKRGRKTRVRGGDPQMEKLAQIYNEFSKKKEIDSSPDTQSKLVDMIDGILLVLHLCTFKTPPKGAVISGGR